MIGYEVVPYGDLVRECESRWMRHKARRTSLPEWHASESHAAKRHLDHVSRPVLLAQLVRRANPIVRVLQVTHIACLSVRIKGHIVIHKSQARERPSGRNQYRHSPFERRNQARSLSVVLALAMASIAMPATGAEVTVSQIDHCSGVLPEQLPLEPNHDALLTLVPGNDAVETTIDGATLVNESMDGTLHFRPSYSESELADGLLVTSLTALDHDGNVCSVDLPIVLALNEMDQSSQAIAVSLAVDHMQATGVDTSTDEAIIAHCDDYDSDLTPCNIITSNPVERQGTEHYPDATTEDVQDVDSSSFFASQEQCKTIRHTNSSEHRGFWFQGRFNSETGSFLFSPNREAQATGDYPDNNSIRLYAEYARGGGIGSDESIADGSVGYGLRFMDQSGDDPGLLIEPRLRYAVIGESRNETVSLFNFSGGSYANSIVEINSRIDNVTQETTQSGPTVLSDQMLTTAPIAGISVDEEPHSASGVLTFPAQTVHDDEVIIGSLDGSLVAEASGEGASVAESKVDFRGDETTGRLILAVWAEYEILAPDSYYWVSDNCVS